MDHSFKSKVDTPVLSGSLKVRVQDLRATCGNSNSKQFGASGKIHFEDPHVIGVG
jgi:hypothetical protein